MRSLLAQGLLQLLFSSQVENGDGGRNRDWEKQCASVSSALSVVWPFQPLRALNPLNRFLNSFLQLVLLVAAALQKPVTADGRK